MAAAGEESPRQAAAVAAEEQPPKNACMMMDLPVARVLQQCVLRRYELAQWHGPSKMDGNAQQRGGTPVGYR